MERLTIDEIIAHCKRQTDGHERRMSAEQYETADMRNFFVQEYWEHRQVAEYLEELKEYRKAEEQGLLRKLPVAVGTKVYYPLRPCGFTTFTIVKIKIYEDEIIFEDDCGNEWEERHFGKVLFLTSEEAESALAEKGGAE